MNINRIYTITLADYSQFVDGKHRNGGCYGYDIIYTYSPEQDRFTREWCTTCELTPDGEPVDGYSLYAALNEMVDFIRQFADTPNCVVYVNDVAVWTSTPQENIDIDMSNYFLDE